MSKENKSTVKEALLEMQNIKNAIKEESTSTIKELLGENRNNALPRLELGIRRGEKYIGRLRLRQAVAGKNFVIADILGDWQQAPVEKRDAVFAE